VPNLKRRSATCKKMTSIRLGDIRMSTQLVYQSREMHPADRNIRGILGSAEWSAQSDSTKLHQSEKPRPTNDSAYAR